MAAWVPAFFKERYDALLWLRCKTKEDNEILLFNFQFSIIFMMRTKNGHGTCLLVKFFSFFPLFAHLLKLFERRFVSYNENYCSYLLLFPYCTSFYVPFFNKQVNKEIAELSISKKRTWCSFEF